MKWIGRVLVFIGALVFGTFAASLFWGEATPSPCHSDPPASVERSTPLRAENLVGTWKGAWGHDVGECTIEIERVDGNDFYGTLKKDGAVVRFEGTFDPKTRNLNFVETKVVRLGADTSEWSLGKNVGNFSRDGRFLEGTGYDKWGQYAWAVSNY
jgi:hypothetical protein